MTPPPYPSCLTTRTTTTTTTIIIIICGWARGKMSWMSMMIISYHRSPPSAGSSGVAGQQ
jgi:hypothetical protein